MHDGRLRIGHMEMHGANTLFQHDVRAAAFAVRLQQRGQPVFIDTGLVPFLARFDGDGGREPMAQVGTPEQCVRGVVSHHDRLDLAAVLGGARGRQAGPAVLACGKHAGVAQILAPARIEQRHEAIERHAIEIRLRIRLDVIDRPDLHREVVLAQDVVEHDQAHVARVVLHVHRNGLGKADLQRHPPLVGLVLHENVRAGEFEVVHAHAETFAHALPEGLHLDLGQRGRAAHQGHEVFEIVFGAVRRQHERESRRVAQHFGGQVRKEGLQQRVQRLHQRGARQGMQALEPVTQGLPERCAGNGARIGVKGRHGLASGCQARMSCRH
eukprot:Opistho-1_new@8203